MPLLMTKQSAESCRMDSSIGTLLRPSEKTKIETNKKFTVYRETYDKTYAIPKGLLKLVGLRVTREDSPRIRFAWNLFYWFEFANLFIVTWLELTNMVLIGGGGSFQDALEIFRMMPCVGYLILAMAKSYKIVYYRPVYENIVSELRGMWPNGEVDEEEHHIINSALKQLNYIVQGYYWCNNALLVIFLSPPFVEIIKRAAGMDVPLIFPFFYWFPFDPFKRVYYEIILTFQTWHGLITIWFMLSGDLLFCIFVSHITTQFDLLSVRVRKMIYVQRDEQLVDQYPLAKYSLEKENREGFNLNIFNDERACLKELINIITRHRALIRLSGDVEELFSFALLVNFINSSIIICFCGFCCVFQTELERTQADGPPRIGSVVEKWNEMVYKTFLTTALSQTWLLCWYGQRLMEASEEFSHALYHCGWYNICKEIKSSILIMLHRSQKKVCVTTYGFSIISLASYTTIINTSSSYFTLLLNVYKK